MDRIILRHLSGSKATTSDEFPLDSTRELTLGRDPASQVKYDPDRDDLVSRAHARIERDPDNASEFRLVDLGSRNGTFLNKQRVSSPARVAPGDVVQLGPGGPEFEFDLDPRPASAIKATRVGFTAAAPAGPATRTADVPPTAAGGAGVPSTSGGAPAGVGRATFEREITRARSQSRNGLFIGGGLMCAVVAVVAGVLIQSNKAAQRSTEARIAADVKQATAKTSLTPEEIAAQNTNSIVYIEVAWHLVEAATSRPIYHRFVRLGGSEYAPGYVRRADGTLEPMLSLEKSSAADRPIGGSGSGTGFVVDKRGWILTNKHVASAWEAPYQGLTRGLEVARVVDGQLQVEDPPQPVDPPTNWVPSTIGGAQLSGKTVEGENVYLDVIFPGNRNRIAAKRITSSPTTDVAMVRADIPSDLTSVALGDKDPAAGADVTVMGYPGVAFKTYAVSPTMSLGERKGSAGIVPHPSTFRGTVGQVVHGEERGKRGDMLIGAGDVIQLDVGTGNGNSGGPVFNNQGEVVGIFTWIVTDGRGNSVKAAVPIRYGKDLMSTSPRSESASSEK